MKNSLLIPNKYKVIGWVLFLISLALCITVSKTGYKIPGFQLYYGEAESSFSDFNLTDEATYLLITFGLLMIVFAKEKIEDEYISSVRLKCLQWSVIVSYAIYIVLAFSYYGLSFLFICAMNAWTILIVFIIRFNWSLYKLKKEGLVDEK